jgi:hypothetical protein
MDSQKSKAESFSGSGSEFDTLRTRLIQVIKRDTPKQRLLNKLRTELAQLADAQPTFKEMLHHKLGAHNLTYQQLRYLSVAREVERLKAELHQA